jgi:hypothetical protein
MLALEYEFISLTKNMNSYYLYEDVKQIRETNLWHSGCSWCSSSSTRGDGQYIHISKSDGVYQWGAPTATGGAVSYTRKRRLWGGALLAMADVWWIHQWWRWTYGVWIDRRYEVMCDGLNGKERDDSWWWCDGRLSVLIWVRTRSFRKVMRQVRTEY